MQLGVEFGLYQVPISLERFGERVYNQACLALRLGGRSLAELVQALSNPIPP